ncbi:MAG: transposase [Acutalibacter sp.]|nr:transposase [Acutalibacter sp.]
MGNLLAVVVHAANIHDTKSGSLAARDAFEKYPSIQRFCADAGYRKTFERDVPRELGVGVDISARIKPEWELLPKRWIVERSLAWLNNSRRLSKDYEISVCSAQAVCIIAAFHTLLKRL